MLRINLDDVSGVSPGGSFPPRHLQGSRRSSVQATFSAGVKQVMLLVLAGKIQETSCRI